MSNNYDYIARYYDKLSRLIFGLAQVNAQTAQLPFIPIDSTILIIGGGSGWILNELAERLPGGLNICYVEQSANMIRIAQKANIRQNNIRFIHAAIEDLVTEETFDVVITAFLFDNFSTATATTVFDKLYQLLKPRGRWLYSDFSPASKKSKLWQSILLKTMYIFFKQVACVEADKLPDMPLLFRQKNCKTLFKQSYYKGFIESVVYEK